MKISYTIGGTQLVGTDRILENVSIQIKDGKIAELAEKSDVSGGVKLPSDTSVYPALINIHDHLRGNYLPKVGPKDSNYYLNWSFWDNDLKSSAVYEERSNITVEDIYRLSAYKNVLSGVVTVNDHFPHEMNSEYLRGLPLRIIDEYALAHECSSFDLNWGDGIVPEFSRAVKKNWPFITHLEEGYDKESQDGIPILLKEGALDNHTIMIHCIGFSDTDIKKTKEAGAHICWCPGSNIFMFNNTCKIKKILKTGINISIGTDSTATGSVNLLEEMRFARKTYRNLYGEDLSPAEIMKMVTINPARAFRIADVTGTIEKDKAADILVLKNKHDDPYENLLAADIEDIELLLWEGQPLYGSSRYEKMFKKLTPNYENVRIRGKEKCVKGKPATLLKTIRQAVGFKKQLDFIPLDD